MVGTMTASTSSAVKRPRHPIIDCDIHNVVSADSLDRFLPERWLRHKRTYGNRQHTGAIYPKGSPGGGARRDAWPPSGMLPGADLGFMQEQHLDPMNVEYGILNCLSGAGTQLNAEYAAALSAATNEWQIAEWIDKDQRLRGGIIVPCEAGDLAAAEIDRMAGHPGFVQVLLVARASEPLGRRKYWPIYAAAERHGLPVGIHFGGGGRGVPVTAAGWPSYYVEDHTSMSQAFQAHVASLIVEGVFEQFPNLRIALIEGGFAWLPPLAWRLDAHVGRLGSEVPYLKRKPSEYVHDHLWVTTQPIEEPHRPDDLHTVFEHLGGVDKVMFSTDYPHWDFDSPTGAFQVSLTPEQRSKIFTENARSFYRLD